MLPLSIKDPLNGQVPSSWKMEPKQFARQKRKPLSRMHNSPITFPATSYFLPPNLEED